MNQCWSKLPGRPRRLLGDGQEVFPAGNERANLRHGLVTKSRHGRGDALHRDGASEWGAKDFNPGVLNLGGVSGTSRFPQVLGTRGPTIAKNGVSLRISKAHFLSHRLRLAWQVVRAYRALVSAGLRNATMGGPAAAPYEKIHALFSPRARAGPRLERIEFRDEVTSGPEGG